MEHVLFIRTYCFLTILWSLSDFDISGEVTQFHNLGHLGEQLYNFIHLKYLLIMGV